MCEHNYAILHPKDPCVICFHVIFQNLTYQEVIAEYKACKELQNKDKLFDYDKVYQSTVKFYIDKKKYSKEKANEIAKIVVEKQQQEWNDKQ